MKQFLLTIIILPFLLSAQTEGKKIFSFSNSPIPDQNITAIATDNTGLNWIGTLKGLICYNGKRWHTITSKNSKLPSNKILSIKIVGNTKYTGTTEGLLVIDNNTWDVYTSKNSKLPSDKIRKIIKIKDNILIATSKGLVKYSNDFEVILSSDKNGIIDDDFISMNVDHNNVVWLGTNSGLYSFSNNIWRIYNTKNSELPNNNIWDIVIDGEGKNG